jgi:hypothetical protein
VNQVKSTTEDTEHTEPERLFCSVISVISVISVVLPPDHLETDPRPDEQMTR